jgi:hypothetical protein
VNAKRLLHQQRPTSAGLTSRARRFFSFFFFLFSKTFEIAGATKTFFDREPCLQLSPSAFALSLCQTAFTVR